MNRLHENALVYGRMMRVDEPHMVSRYDTALAGFGLKPCGLDAFEIDMVGWSPQVAEALGDRRYLDPGGVNRRFILLSPEQRRLPVVASSFSNTGQLMHRFLESNARAVNALTIKDVVYGEIDDPVLEARDIEDLLAIEQVEFKVFTGDDVAAKATELRTLSDRVLKEPDAWADDELLTRMVALAKVTGDIRTNTLVPDELVFRQDAFWTEHFGGVYVFLDERQTTVIGDPDAPGFRRSRPWQVAYIDRRDRALVYRFLLETGRVEPPRGAWIERSGFLDHRIEMALTKLAFAVEPDRTHDPADRRWRKRWLASHADAVNEEGTVPFLQWAAREMETWAQIDLDEIDARGRFLLSRANPAHKDAWLVNRLMSEYVPFDFLARFAFHKEGFYADYETWPDALQDHVVKRVAEDYLKDKKGFRRRLFGLVQ